MEGTTANAIVGSLSQACPFMVFSSPLFRVALPQLDLPQIILSHISPTQLMCVLFCLYPLSSILSLTFLTHPTHSYLLLPHLIFCNSESAYSFYIYLPHMIITRVCLCAGPALNISDWRLLLYSLSLDINLDSFTCLPYSNPASPGYNSYYT